MHILMLPGNCFQLWSECFIKFLKMHLFLLFWPSFVALMALFSELSPAIPHSEPSEDSNSLVAVGGNAYSLKSWLMNPCLRFWSKSLGRAGVTTVHLPGWSCKVLGAQAAWCFPVRIQCARPMAPCLFMNGIQKDTYISINKLGIQWLLLANQGRLINLASCLINELWLITY